MESSEIISKICPIDEYLLSLGFEKKKESIYEKHLLGVKPYVTLVYNRQLKSVSIWFNNSFCEVVSGFLVRDQRDLSFLLSHCLPLYFYIPEARIFDISVGDKCYQSNVSKWKIFLLKIRKKKSSRPRHF